MIGYNNSGGVGMSGIKVERPDKDRLEAMGVSSWPIWEKEVSKFDWSYDQEEVCYILDGEVTVQTKDGGSVSFGPGDLVTFPKGMECKWDIKSPVRKHYSFN